MCLWPVVIPLAATPSNVIDFIYIFHFSTRLRATFRPVRLMLPVTLFTDWQNICTDSRIRSITSYSGSHRRHHLLQRIPAYLPGLQPGEKSPAGRRRSLVSPLRALISPTGLFLPLASDLVLLIGLRRVRILQGPYLASRLQFAS